MLKYTKTNIGLFLSLSFFLLATCSTICGNNPYKTVREQFKDTLCALQGGLMSDRDYLQFIEPHLQKAERELSIIKHLQTKPALNDHDENYMGELAFFNMALFQLYVNPKNLEAKIGYERSKQKLTNAIRSIKESDRVQVDVNAEFKKTDNLLTIANKEFYKKLNVKNKALLFFVL